MISNKLIPEARGFLSLAALCFFTASTLAHDPAGAATKNWPQWRGPSGTGATQGNPPTEWSETKNIKWKSKIPGVGHSTPIIWGDNIFIQAALPTGRKTAQAEESQPNEGPRGRRGGGRGRGETRVEAYQFNLLCFDRETGKLKWQKTAREEVPHEGHHQDHGYSSYSPVTDGKHVYAYFGSRGLHCFDFEGNRKWEKDFGSMQTRNGFGEGTSPALHGNTIVVIWDHEGEDDFIVALDKNNGKELWRQKREEPTTWTTPLIVEHEGKHQVITSGTTKIRSYDLETGKLIWECGGMTVNVIPTPVAADGVVYVTSGFRGNALLAIELGHTGDLTGTEAILWQHNKGTPYVPSPLLSGNRLYLLSHNNAILSCFDAKTGQILIDMERLPSIQNVYASPVAAGGRIYITARNGTTLVIKDAPKVEVLATNPLDDDIDASPAVVGNQLFLRGENHLYCIASE